MTTTKDIQKQLDALQAKVLQSSGIEETLEIALAAKKLKDELAGLIASADDRQKEALIEATKTELSSLDLVQIVADAMLEVKLTRNKDTGVFDNLTCSLINKKLSDSIYASWPSLDSIQALTTVNSITCKIDYADTAASEVTLASKGKATNGNGGQSNGKKGWEDASGQVLALKEAYKLVESEANAEQVAKFSDDKKGASAKWAYMTKVLKDNGTFTKLT